MVARALEVAVEGHVTGRRRLHEAVYRELRVRWPEAPSHYAYTAITKARAVGKSFRRRQGRGRLEVRLGGTGWLRRRLEQGFRVKACELVWGADGVWAHIVLEKPVSEVSVRGLLSVDVNARLRQLLHTLSARVVRTAAAGGLAIALENLRGLKEYNRVEVLTSGLFNKLQAYIAYKAALVGIPVVWVDPRGTSSRCPVCERSKLKRDSMSPGAVSCGACGLRTHRQRVGAVGVGRRALQAKAEAAASAGRVGAVPGVGDRSVVRRTDDGGPQSAVGGL